MSTILKALRRLEDERAAATQKTLHDEVVAPSRDASAGGRRPAWLLVAIAVIGMGAGVAVTALLASYFGSGGGNEATTVAPALAATAPPAVPAAPPAVPAAPPAVPAAPPAVPAAPPAVPAAPPAVPKAPAVRAPAPAVRVAAKEPTARRALPAPPPVAAAPQSVAEPTPGPSSPAVERAESAARVAVVERPPAKPTFVASEAKAPGSRVPPRGSVPPSAGIAAVNGLVPESVVRSSPPPARASIIPKKRYPSRAKPDPVVAAEAAPLVEPDASLPKEMSGGIPGPTPAFLAAEESWDDGFPAGAIADPPQSDPWAAGAARMPAPTPAPAKAAPRMASVPEVDVVRTVWHPQADRRTAEVRLDGSSETLLLREGDELGPLLLVAIEPSGIVLHHDGEEMRRRIVR